jgi:PhnB protein
LRAEEEIPMSTSNVPTSPVVPYLTLSDATSAIEFYKRAFSAQVAEHHLADDGKRVMHETLLINGGVVMLADDFPEFSGGKPSSPAALGGTGVTIQFDLKDADALWKQAVDAGTQVVMPLADQFWGDRYGILADPFGHRWALFTHKPKPQA